MGVRTRFRWYRPMESNSIVNLCHLNESNCKFNQPIFKISSGWIRIFRKSFICLSLYTLLIYVIRTRTLFMSFHFIGPYLLFQHIDLGLIYQFFLPIPFRFFFFSQEFGIFSHLGFTYTTYITVKSEFFLFQYFEAKDQITNLKKALGCAIHMKEYTIMLYLVNKILWSNNEPF